MDSQTEHNSMVCQVGHFVREKFCWLPPLLARVTIGYVFIESGWGKLHHLDKVIAFFTELGIPAARLQAPFVATVEFVGGTLVLLGLLTRVAAVPLIGVMVVAILTAKLSQIAGLSDLFGAIEYLYIVLLVYLAVFGGGALSLDRLVCCRKKSREN